MDTPILLLFFNRSKSVKKLIDILRIVKPKKLFISIDGPRKNNINDISEIRKIIEIVDTLNWQCEIMKKINKNNLGCKLAVSSAINWFFKNNEHGIILEDDCIPNLSFFKFCEYGLQKYKNNKKVMQISGNNFLFNNKMVNDSYYYSTLNDIWGWATWKSAWDKFDINMSEYDFNKDYKMLIKYYKNKKIVKWIKIYLDAVKIKEHNIWSTQWTYAMIKEGGLTVVPKVNLVKNIGFNKYGSTSDYYSFRLYDKVDICELSIDKIPNKIEPNYAFDKIRYKIIKKTDPNLSLRYKLRPYIPKKLRKIIKSIFF